MQIFWLLVILAFSLQPIIRQKMLEAARFKLMAKLEKARGTRVITLIHRRETMSFLGFPVVRYIDIEDSEAILRAIQLTDPKVPIDLIVHSPGGLVLAAGQIAQAIQRHPARVTVFIPHYAMSGGTLIALAADEIVMAPNAVLGPVDPQLGDRPAASILKIIRQKPIERIDDTTLIQADLAEKAIRQVKDTVRKLLVDQLPPADADKLAETLTSGTWTHDYPISVDEARQLGLNVNTDMPQEVYQIMCLYPQARQHRPSVEYIPGSREAPDQSAPYRNASDR